MKKLLMVIGILVGLLVIVAIAAPFFVDVDKYRPQIVQKANESLNGKLELGKLSLSLWGQIRVQVDGLKLDDARGNPVISVKDAYFHIPLSSVLSGSPSVILSLQQPNLNVVKEKNGKLNVMGLMKPSTGAPSQPQAAPQARQGEVKLPGMATRARAGLEIRNANLSYRDEVSGMKTQVKELDVIAHDISLSHKMTLEVSANLNSEGGVQVKGPARLNATADPKVSGGKFESVDVAARVNLDDLEIRMPGVFEKQKGVDAHADLNLKVSTDAAQIEKMTIQFFNAQINGKGSVTRLASGPTVDLQMKSNTIELKPWVQLVPMLKQYDLGGSADLSAEAHGPSDKLGYKALFQIKGLTAKAPNLKTQPRIDATVSVITDQVDRLLLTMKAPGNELSVSGKVIGFKAPRLNLEVSSGGMDLDQLIEFPSAAAKEEKQAATSKSGTGRPAPQADYDAMLAPVRENKALQSMIANIGVNIRSIKTRGVNLTDVAGKISMRDLVASVDSFGLKVFGGTVKANASTNLRPKAPTYKFGTSVAGLDIQQAVASQYQFFKNTVLGKASLDMNGEGASFNPTPAISNLKAKGKMKVQNATLTTVDVGKIVSEGLGGAIAKVSDKVPGMKGKQVGLPGGQSKYELISSDFSISDGRFSAPNFVGKAVPHQGIDLKGDVAVGLKDQSLKANLQVIDTYNLTHARDIAVAIGGSQVEHVLAEGNGPVKFPITVGCTLSAPCYSYTQVAEYFVKIAMSNATGALKKNAARSLIKQAPPGVQDQLQNLGKKFFGH